MSREVWRSIPRYRGLYEISDRGRARSLERYVVYMRLGRRRRMYIKGCLLRPSPRAGYPTVELYKNGVPDKQSIHHLVLITFVGRPPKGHECRHLNGTRADARLTNLKWGTGVENMADCIAHGRHPHGEVHKSAKLTEADVLGIKRDHKRNGRSYSEMARALGVFPSTVRNAFLGRTWRHLLSKET